MDNAVALARAYLHVNGYFTVTEYPVLEAPNHGGFRTVTDIDVMAFRFAGAGFRVAGSSTNGSHSTSFESDPELGIPGNRADMLIGEVREGRARLNKSFSQPEVLQIVLSRFGCCSPDHAPAMKGHLLRRGHATTPEGHQARLVVFASSPQPGADGGFQVMNLGHVVRFLQSHLEEHWDVLHHAQFEEPAFGFLMTPPMRCDRTRKGYLRAISRKGTHHS